jgi:hypothetical protein
VDTFPPFPPHQPSPYITGRGGGRGVWEEEGRERGEGRRGVFTLAPKKFMDRSNHWFSTLKGMKHVKKKKRSLPYIDRYTLIVASRTASLDSEAPPKHTRCRWPQ